MYSPDTLQRLNEDEVKRQRESAEKGECECEYCGEKKPLMLLPVYNPADAVRDVEGAYSTLEICQDCLDEGRGMDDLFYCDGCGELFIQNHSWDSLIVITDDGCFCHSCALENIEGIQLGDLLKKIREGDVKDFLRIDNFPGKKEIWSGEYSDFSDFPGHTSLDSVADSIEKKAFEENLGPEDIVYPLLTKTFQFSVVLGIYF